MVSQNAILEEKELEYEFKWGSTSWLGYVAETFKLKFATRLFGRCVGALDGISIRIQKPGSWQTVRHTTANGNVSIGKEST